MTLQRFAATDSVEEMLSAFDDEGGIVVEGMFATDTIEAMRDAVVEASAGFAPGAATQGLGEDGKAFVGARTVRFSSLGKVSPAYFEMLDNPIFAALADAVLLPNCGSYWVNTGQAMLIGPGEPAQVLHRDANNWPQYMQSLWPNCPEVTVSAMIALDDVTEELGATRVVPGSHKWQTLNRFESDLETVPAEMRQGDGFVYSGKVLHGGGANQSSDRWRNAMHLSFVVGWLTPEEANAIDYTTEELQSQSPRVQRLLGHRSYDPRPTSQGGGLWLQHVAAIEDQFS